jgi:hypothetical protein
MSKPHRLETQDQPRQGSGDFIYAAKHGRADMIAHIEACKQRRLFSAASPSFEPSTRPAARI